MAWIRTWGQSPKKKNKGKKMVFDSYEEYEEYSYGGSYDYGFNRKASGEDSLTAWNSWEKTGNWHGYNYYRSATIDYRYIEQMANAFSAQHNIKITAGQGWAIDLKNKELVYSPLSLMYGTKADVIASLLHEIGHLRYTTPPEEIKKGPILSHSKYSQEAFMVLNLFEDFRVDARMYNSYAGAPDVYESTKSIVKSIAEKYIDRANQVREYEKNTAQRRLQNLLREVENPEMHREDADKIGSQIGIDAEKVEFVIDVSPEARVAQAQTTLTKIASTGNLSDYMAAMILSAYNIPIEKDMFPNDTMVYLSQTVEFIERSKLLSSTQEVEDMLEKEVLPLIKPLLEQKEKGSEGLQDALGEESARNVSSEINSRLYSTGAGYDSLDKPVGDSSRNGDIESRLSQKAGKSNGGGDIPKQWLKGDYDSLRQSVDGPIKELYRLIKDIKANDNVTRWEENLRTGKISTKNVYRYPSGRFDFFRKKKPTIDRVKSFAFSVVVDESGSMHDGNRLKSISAARGTIILNEVLSKMNIPLEIIGFGGSPKMLKSFEQSIKSEDVRRYIGEIAIAPLGNTNLLSALGVSKLDDRPEMNKVMVILTDGDTSGREECRRKILNNAKLGIKTIGIDVSQESVLRMIVDKENVIELEKAEAIPEEFEKILKKLIRQKTK
jgi:hypothetical protein